MHQRNELWPAMALKLNKNKTKRMTTKYIFSVFLKEICKMY